ncbi:hypothetical protein [Phenylobacterium sp.]|uniref:hypothetical protein n=1 Tax=Phenylobacterium sp. TaxID=1871053 RepID=UPI003D2B283C
MRSRVLFGTFVVGTLTAAQSSLAAVALQASGPAASASAPSSHLGTFPPHAASCIRKHLNPQVLRDAVAVAPDPGATLASFERHVRSIDSAADKCGFAATEQGGEQLGSIVTNLALKEWSEGRLRTEFSVSPDQLSAAMKEIPQRDVATIGALDGPRMSDTQKERLADVLPQVAAKLGLRDQKASALLAAYVLSAARLAPFE